MASRAREGHKAERRESRLVAAPAEVSPQTPLDFALAVMRDGAKPAALRAGMAKAALPYLHKRGEEEEKDAEPRSESMSDLELARRVAYILALGDKQQDGAAAEFSSPSPSGEGGRE